MTMRGGPAAVESARGKGGSAQGAEFAKLRRFSIPDLRFNRHKCGQWTLVSHCPQAAHWRAAVRRSNGWA